MVAPASAGPLADYRRRLSYFQTEGARLDRCLAWAGNSRFALAAVAAVLVVATIFAGLASPWWLSLAVAGFLALTVVFERTRRAKQIARRAIAHYELGLARLEDRWAGQGISGNEFLDEHHPYAADLDLFGRGSLFERLCEARSHIGRQTLADWLTVPAAPDVVRQRQQAVADLRDRGDWCERLALLAANLPEGVDTAGLAAWGAAGIKTLPWAMRIGKVLLLTTLITLAGWSVDFLPDLVPVTVLLVQSVFAFSVRQRVHRALRGLAGRSRELLHLSGVLLAVENEAFSAPRLRALQDALRTDGVSPSQRLVQLVHLVQLHDSTRNIYFAVVAPIFLWTTRVGLAVEEWRAHAGPALGRWAEVIGEVESLTSLAAYAYENPDDPFPELDDTHPLIDAVALGHPLLPRLLCVRNDLRLDDVQRLLIVSGSNMSGKSTFLRAIGVNVVLAQAGAPVRATRLRLSPLAIGATLRIQDSLQAGTSRFYAEITRLRQIVELTQDARPVLFLLDEILHGTNSHDRRIGAEAIIQTLLERPSLGLVTTHDLALTRLADRLAPKAVNVHFADRLDQGTLQFDYRLHEGVVRHSNALALMRAVGLNVKEGDLPEETAR
jgi:hypothetical protein